MQANQKLDGVRQARALFEAAGLKLPFIPERLRSKFKERDKWCFATRAVGHSPYNFDFYIGEARKKTVNDYVILGHAGHGVNSYAIHFYLVSKPVFLFLQLGWGGVYMDEKETTAHVNRCFELADKVVALAEQKTKGGPLSRRDCILIGGSDFYGCAWTKPGETELRKEPNPQSLLKAVLDWLEKA